MGESGRGESVAALLTRLQSADASAAWSEFLAQYAALLLRVVKSRVGADGEAPHDAFLYVCEKLSDEGFARLTRFEPGGRAKFSTWLAVVAARLSVDWLRARRGRKRPFANVAAMAPLERALFRHRYERRLSLRECFAVLRAEFPNLTETHLRVALANLDGALTPEQRWRLGVRGAPELPLEAAVDVAHDETPEDGAADLEAHAQLASALAELDPRDRLLIAYRYEQDLTFEQIAKLMQLGDPFRARRAVDAAVSRVRERFSAPRTKETSPSAPTRKK